MSQPAEENSAHKLTFDRAKSDVNEQKHGLRLEDFKGFDAGTLLTLKDERKDYGEFRYRSFGRINGLAHMIAFTIRNEELRLISFRRAHKKEMQRYGR